MQNHTPNHVEEDLVAGFTLTNIDDGYLRCKKISPTEFVFRCDINEELYEETININNIDINEAVLNRYDSVDEVVKAHGERRANMIIAECYFENIRPMQIPQ